MASVRFENVSISYGAKQVVKDFSLSVNDGEIMGIIGPSGCGKTTLIRALCGLIKPEKGNIYINDQLVFSDEKRINVAPERRGIGVVFQDYAVWPHLSVWDNVCYPMKKHKVPKEEIAKRAAYALEQVRMTGYEKHMPAQLSGGQQQRVALARALVIEPSVLLFDEPLSNLDANLRNQMRSEIIQLHERIGATTIYVTHDQTEAMTMADRIVVMKGGYIQQIGSPKEIYNNPANLFVAGFLGAPATNFIKGTYQDGFFYVDDMKIELPLMYREKLSSYQEKEIIMGIRPEDLHGEGIVADTYPSANFDFEIEVAELLGHEYILHGSLNGQKMCAKVNSRLEPEAHTTIKLTMDLSKVHFFDLETENRID